MRKIKVCYFSLQYVLKVCYWLVFLVWMKASLATWKDQQTLNPFMYLSFLVLNVATYWYHSWFTDCWGLMYERLLNDSSQLHESGDSFGGSIRHKDKIVLTFSTNSELYLLVYHWPLSFSTFILRTPEITNLLWNGGSRAGWTWLRQAELFACL